MYHELRVHIKHQFSQNGLHKAQRCVNFDVCEWRPHSHPQFPRSTHGTPGTMTPLLATKSLAFYDTGVPSEARVINITACMIQSPEHDLAEWRSASGHRHKKK